MHVGWLSPFLRFRAHLGRLSMYRLVLYALTILAAISLALSFFGEVVPRPWELLATLAVTVIACGAADAIAQKLVHRAPRFESSLITALILLFILRPSVDPVALAGIAGAAVIASASKYVLAWRGRHLFNPAAVGASVLTVVAASVPLEVGLSTSAWWVGTPVLAIPVILLGLAVLWRTEKVGVVGLFFTVAVLVSIVRVTVQYADAGLQLDAGTVVWQVLAASPLLFLGAFMLSEPLTLPPLRWQQCGVAVLVGVLAGWPVFIGSFSLGQERALLIGNLLAFVLCRREALQLTLRARQRVGQRTEHLTFVARGLRTFSPGQYLELTVPHALPDARGTRREFSIASAPSDLPELRIAYRRGDPSNGESTFKKALGQAPLGQNFTATSVAGNFLLPRDRSEKVLMIAAGIGITPYISQLREMQATAKARDIVLLYVVGHAGDLQFREDIEAAPIRVVVFSPGNDPDIAYPQSTSWADAHAQRLTAQTLRQHVPDLAERRAFISGPPALLADLAPALQGARSVRTDAFSGY